jgi:hypothetical protein
MNPNGKGMLLVGDNPFHGISHLSQEKARNRGMERGSAASADIVAAALRSGADGFMFSVSDVTLSILKSLRERREVDQIKLYAIVPYAYEYVRIATQTGTPGLAKKIVKQIALSGDIGAVLGGLGAVFRMKRESLLKTYLAYEISRIRSSIWSKAELSSVLLHEVITDMSLALNFDWLFKSYISYLSKKDIIPGFNTRNFPFLVRKFKEWGLNVDEILVATQFNKAGFQMNPSREACEETLSNLSRPVVLAISVLAAGYYRPPEAAEYIATQEKLRGIVIGASSVEQAKETFEIFSSTLSCRKEN